MGRILTLRGVVPQGRRERVFFFDSNIQTEDGKSKTFKFSLMMSVRVIQHWLYYTRRTSLLLLLIGMLIQQSPLE